MIPLIESAPVPVLERVTSWVLTVLKLFGVANIKFVADKETVGVDWANVPSAPISKKNERLNALSACRPALDKGEFEGVAFEQVYIGNSPLGWHENDNYGLEILTSKDRRIADLPGTGTHY